MATVEDREIECDSCKGKFTEQRDVSEFTGHDPYAKSYSMGYTGGKLIWLGDIKESAFMLCDNCLNDPVVIKSCKNEANQHYIGYLESIVKNLKEENKVILSKIEENESMIKKLKKLSEV